MQYGYSWILCVCLFIVCVAVAAQPYVTSHFHYTRAHSSPVLDPHGRLGLNDSCSLCFGDESCLTLDDSRCRFYQESGSILDEAEDQDEIDIEGATATREEVDELFGDLAQKVKEEKQFTECVPLVSYYTDCNKENICIGCKSCSCDDVGKWNCSQVQRCQPPDAEVVVDHRVLQVVIEKLTDKKPASMHKEGNRTKRAITELNEAELTNVEPWMYIQPQRERVLPEDLVSTAITPLYNDELRAMTEDIFKEIKRKLIRDSKKQKALDDIESNNLQQNPSNNNPVDQDNFSFDEILSSISVNNSSPEIANEQLAVVNKSETIEFQNLLNEIRESANEKYKNLSRTIYNAKPLNKTKLEKNDDVESITSSNEFNKTNFVDVLDFLEGISEIRELSTEKNIVRRKNINDGVSNMNLQDITIHNEKTENTTYLKNTSPNGIKDKLIINAATKNYSDKPKIELEEIKKMARRNIQDLLLGINEIRESSTPKSENDDKHNLSDFENASTNDEKINDVDEESIENLNKVKRGVNNSAKRVKREVLKQNVHNVTDIKNIEIKTNVTKTVTTNSPVSKTVTTISSVSNETEISQYLHDLNENIINPLNDIIAVKLSEIKELLEVKEKIMNFTKANKLVNVLKDKSNVDIDKPHVSIYKLEILPTSTEVITRRKGGFADGDYNVLSKDFEKFKHDLFELMHDIVRLKKTMKVQILPLELRYLMRALSIYIRKQIIKENKSRKPHFVPHDRYWLRNIWRQTRRYSKTVEDFILDILSLIDRDLPTFNALDSLSLKAKKVLKRVIKELYLKENSVNNNYKDIVAHNNFKLLNDFKAIGNSWNDMITSLKSCDVTNRLYEMKRLHLSVSADILKIQKTLEFFDFANSRRLVLFEENQGENLLLNIENKILLTINVIKTIFENFNKNNRKEADIMIQKVEIKHKTRRTKSFLRRLKNIFKGTKFDFLTKLHNHKYKDQSGKILNLKQLTQKKILEYKNIVKKWQEKLNIVSKREKKDFYKNEDQKYNRNEEIFRIQNTTLLKSQG